MWSQGNTPGRSTSWTLALGRWDHDSPRASTAESPVSPVAPLSVSGSDIPLPPLHLDGKGRGAPAPALPLARDFSQAVGVSEWADGRRHQCCCDGILTGDSDRLLETRDQAFLSSGYIRQMQSSSVCPSHPTTARTTRLLARAEAQRHRHLQIADRAFRYHVYLADHLHVLYICPCDSNINSIGILAIALR